MNKVTEKKEELLTRFDEKFAKEEVADSWDYSELHDFSSLGVYSRIKVFISHALDEMADTARSEAITEVRAWANSHYSYSENSDLDPSSMPMTDTKELLLWLDQLKAHTGQEEKV